MENSDESIRERLAVALAAYDEGSRAARIDRIVWLSSHNNLPSAMLGQHEVLHMLQEARQTFVCGHYAAALLLAMAVIEHSLVEELQLRAGNLESPSFADAISRAVEAQVIPPEWEGPLRHLSRRRNPLAHLKPADHSHTLGARLAGTRDRPKELLEGDAKEAMEWMYKVFRATLRTCAPNKRYKKKDQDGPPAPVA